MQRRESCEDQEREVRAVLSRFGVDLTHLIVINDEAQSGTKVDRTGFLRLLRMIEERDVAILAVDDQSRLSRAGNALAFIQDLVYADGRFISTTESIDTAVSGWELKVKILEIHNSQTISGLKDKVRRGQRGRVLAGDSAGDFGYGYESFYRDADWEQQVARRGPAPKKGIRICDVQSHWVRTMFAWFIEGLSLRAIARSLVEAGAPKNRRAGKIGWSQEQVRRILRNKKYIGVWVWGATTALGNSTGQKRRIAAPSHDMVTEQRPDLRIIDQETWNHAQARIAVLKQKFASEKTHGKKGRKTPTNPASVFPQSLLGGVLKCSACGSAMWLGSTPKRRHYYCAGHRTGVCTAVFQFVAGLAEREVVKALTDIVIAWPDWIRDLHSRLLKELSRRLAEHPAERVRDEKRLVDLKRRANNLVEAIAQGGGMSTTIGARLVEAERELAEVEARLEALESLNVEAITMPDEGWVRAQLAEWVKRLEGSRTVALAIREALASLTAEAVIPPGKKRGYVRLHLSVNGWGVLKSCIGANLPLALSQLLPNAKSDIASAPVVITIGGPTKIDQNMPDIMRWRNEGITWKEISKRTGLCVSNLFIAWKRYGSAYKST